MRLKNAKERIYIHHTHNMNNQEEEKGDAKRCKDAKMQLAKNV